MNDNKTISSRNSNYLQFTEERYGKMSDAKFVKAFEDDHDDEDEIGFTLIKKKTIPFFMANISRKDREELEERFEVEDAYWQELLDFYPDLIGKIPASLLYGIPANERLYCYFTTRTRQNSCFRFSKARMPGRLCCRSTLRISRRLG